MKNNELGQHIPLHYHYHMLSDENRIQAFKKAIEMKVKKGDHVVELGSGTGVLSYFAAKTGARVTAIEKDLTLITKSREFLRDNLVAQLVTVIEGDALIWEPDEPVNVVICEMLHNALLREKQVAVMTHFMNSHQKRFGYLPITIPSNSILAVQPVWQNYNFSGFNAKVPVFQDAYITAYDTVSCHDPLVYEVVSYNLLASKSITCDVVAEFKSKGQVNALRFITKSIIASTNNDIIDWHNQYMVLPLNQVYEVNAISKMRIEFTYEPGESIQTLEDQIRVTML